MSLDEYLTFGLESFDSLLELEVMQTKIMTCTSIRFYKDLSKVKKGEEVQRAQQQAVSSYISNQKSMSE